MPDRRAARGPSARDPAENPAKAPSAKGPAKAPRAKDPAKAPSAKDPATKSPPAKTPSVQDPAAKATPVRDQAARRSRAARTAETPLASDRAVRDAPAGTRAARPPAVGSPAGRHGPAARLDVRKTYKLFVGGAFPRSESGRSYPVRTPDGTLLGYAAQASRKDARDAVRAARSAFAGWSGATAYNRGQVLYRVAELMEGRFAQFAADVAAAEGLPASASMITEFSQSGEPRKLRDHENGAGADGVVAAAIDRWVWYAGWPDKIAQVAGGANPVAGPYFNFSVPEPTGVVAVIAPPDSSLLGLVSVLAPVIATGNTAVVVTSEHRPLPSVTLAEVLATSDVPPGVVNLLTGHTAELAPVLAGHMDVNAVDLTGAPPDGRAELEWLAAGNIKRVLQADDDWAAPPGTRRMLAFLETKTVWHPVGI